MSPKIDYAQLWKDKKEGAPKQSIISSLQKLLVEKDEAIYNLQTQITALKQQQTEHMQIMDQMEQEFIKQKARIEELEAGGGGGKISRPTIPGGSADFSNAPPSAKQQIDQLNKQLREMENKLYVFSHLPDRITQLEEKIEKQNKIIENYETNEEKMRATIRKLSGETGSQSVMQEMEQKIQQLTRELNTLKGQTDQKSAPVSFDDEEGDSLRRQLIAITDEKNRLLSQLSDSQNKNQEAQAKLEAARKTIMSLQASAGQAANVNDLQNRLMQIDAESKAKDNTILQLQKKISDLSNQKPIGNPATPSANMAQLSELQMENQKLKATLEDTKQKLRTEQIKIEDIVSQAQRSGKGVDLSLKVSELNAQVQTLSSENAALKQDLDAKEKQLKSASGDLIGTLNMKIERLTSVNKKLEEDLKKAKSESSLGVPKPIGGPKFIPGAPLIREVDSGVKEDPKVMEELNQLRKQVAEKDNQISKLSQEVAEAQTQLAQMKIAGPQDASNANMMSLLSDLQMKNKKLKEQLRQRDEELAKLKS